MAPRASSENGNGRLTPRSPSDNSADGLSQSEILALELSTPGVVALVYLALGMSPLTATADSTTLFKRSNEVAREADDPRLLRICDHFGKLVSGTTKF